MKIKVPDTKRCGNRNCRFPMRITNADRAYPDKNNTPENEIHILYDLNEPMYSFQCHKCGHYTVNKPMLPNHLKG